MKRRLLLSLIAAGMALGAGVASANSSYWRANGLLLEVSADPRDGNDIVQVDPTHASSLDLVALNARVDLRGIVVRFTHGPELHLHVNGVLPGQPMRVKIPRNRGAITSVELAYIRPDLRPFDRTPARLQIIPNVDHGGYYNDDHSDHEHVPQSPTYPYGHPTHPYQQPTYQYQQPTYQYRRPTYQYQQPRYQYRPRQSGWSGYVQGSFRF